ncbi:hypothetical protein GQ55_3G135700 [Panicum hallii var. hallii]|uniref:Uncharacterized protein n=1 Tax=Panicum hallii var. hallii TaxID=1504633 RepID=A0A2T7E922_9POAL|nr:hypothetical protein GQ55_3G135700 [Panicum hallii var. hallii]
MHVTRTKTAASSSVVHGGRPVTGHCGRTPPVRGDLTGQDRAKADGEASRRRDGSRPRPPAAPSHDRWHDGRPAVTARRGSHASNTRAWPREPSPRAPAPGRPLRRAACARAHPCWGRRVSRRLGTRVWAAVSAGTPCEPTPRPPLA